jgi:hypothetical protein
MTAKLLLLRVRRNRGGDVLENGGASFPVNKRCVPDQVLLEIVDKNIIQISCKAVLAFGCWLFGNLFKTLAVL